MKKVQEYAHRDIDLPYQKIYYLAHPYSSNPAMNVLESIDKTNKLLDKGYIVFNPLTHSHFLDAYKKRTSKFWYEYDLKILEMCDGIILSGDWKNSKGCLLEKEFAEKKRMEILFYEELIE